MKKKTSIIAILFVIIFTITATAATLHSVKYYEKLVKREKIGRVREYWNEDITTKILEGRGDDIIIEKIIGVVVDKKRNGKVLNYVDENYDYISYKKVRKAKKGDVILTILIYEPNSKGTDDIADRFDYIIDRTR